MRHGDDREAGRLGRARQHHGGHAAERRRPGRRVRAARPQVVLLGADVRPVPRARPGPRGPRRASPLPRVLPDGTRNAFHLQRLKDKLGNRSNASSEVEFHGAWARHGRRAGPRRADDHRDGRPHAAGLRDRRRRPACAGAVANATWHAAHRAAFGRRLADQPLMRNVLADLAIEAEAATALAHAPGARLRRGRRRRAGRALKRLATAVGQVLGLQARSRPRLRGAGVPGRQRLRRGVGDAAPVPRGAAGLDLGGLGQRHVPRRPARAGARRPRRSTRSSTRSSWRPAPTARLDAFVAGLRGELADPEAVETRARRVVEGLALALQGSLLVRHAPRRGRRRVLRLAPGRRRRPALRHAARRAPTWRRSSRATRRRRERVAARHVTLAVAPGW